MNRMEYADSHREQYLDWCGEIDRSPFDKGDMMELAAISAHTPFDSAAEGFLRTRGVEDMQTFANILHRAGVLGPANKAGYCFAQREMLAEGEVAWPEHDYRQWRRDWKLPGLGMCKVSFAICLADPFSSNVLCLDTHMLQALGYKPQQCGRVQARRGEYEYEESVLLIEAEEVGMPAFAYQWAVWDHQRATVVHVPPTDHSFLWRGGARTSQLRMEV